MSGLTSDRRMIDAMKLSLAIGILMLVAKVFAYLSTGSAAIFSDAAESVVHNVAVGFALYSLWFSLRPADKNHPYGHTKIGYFSAGFEGSMIILAGLVIIIEATKDLIRGPSPQNLDFGLLVTIGAAAVNAVLGFYLIARGRKHHSLILEANGRHVLTDSWTSLGVIVGLALTKWTGWTPFDPICAILVALNIFWSGIDLIRKSFGGLMDEADPATEAIVRKTLDAESARLGITYHELRHRQAGPTTWIDVHLLFPDRTTVVRAHAQATEIEESVKSALQGSVQITTHIEPRDDHAHIHQDEPSSPT